MKEILYIIIPAHNESENIPRLIREWYPVIEKHDGGGKSRLVVIDDGSMDATYAELYRYASHLPLLLPLTKRNEGHGPTLFRGYRYALRHHAEFVFQTDADGQTDPDEFEKFWEQRHRYEAVFGKRTVRGDGKKRALIERILCRILRHYFGVDLPDANAPFRLMSADYLRKYLPKIPRKYNLPNVMLTVFGAYYHERICFLPIRYHARKGGEQSLNTRKILRIGWNAVRDFRAFRARMHRAEKSGK